MPSLKHIFRVLLILALCVDGVASAWASTEMALKLAEHAASASADTEMQDAKSAAASTKASADCEKASPHDNGSKPAVSHVSCECDNQAACGCSCMLSLYSANSLPLFIAQYLPANLRATPHPVQPFLSEITPVFRPPIG